MLFVAGCPNRHLACERLGSALSAIGRADLAIQERMVADGQEATGLGMAGSPTILVNGRDPFAREGGPSLSCRLYRDGDGRPDGAPSVEELIRVLRP